MRPADVDFDVVVAGGGPAGATAAHDLALAGRRVLLLDRAGRVKPCGGAVPTRLLRDFEIPSDLITARVRSARIHAPSGSWADMRIDDGFVGMVDRDVFDPWLRRRAALAGATVQDGQVLDVRREAGRLLVGCRMKSDANPQRMVSTRIVVGADGAGSAVRRSVFGPQVKPAYVFAYHEVVHAPDRGHPVYDPARCEVSYDPAVSPDFYGWSFPHGATASIGIGSAVRGFDLRAATGRLRAAMKLSDIETLRREGAPLPLRPLQTWHAGDDVVLIGDAAGAVAPASGEGIYYAMASGRIAAQQCYARLEGERQALAGVRRRFVREHGTVFWVLGMMQSFWYRNAKRRERFVAICGDPDVQKLVWASYLDKKLVRTDPMAHLRVVAKDMRHLVRLAFE